MAVIVAEFEEPVRGPGGGAFHARACGLPFVRGSWQGWIEFNPLDGAPTFRSPHETVQSSCRDLETWAGGLTGSCLEAALQRALYRLGRDPSLA